VKPLIGLGAYPRRIEIAIGPVLLHTASRFYVDAIVRAGGLPVVLPVIDPDDVPEMLRAVDGIVLTGGGDVEPSRYGQQPAAENWGVDPARDDFEEALLRCALERDLPVLATCRGMQLVNVAMGGTLVQHIPDVSDQLHSQEPHWREGIHRVKIEPDSQLAEALGVSELDVNSLHHQAVLEPAPGLRAVAWADDDTVEAVEIPGNRHFVAVQWHPELLEDFPEQQGLFRQLVSRAGELAANS
jgi:gamma-glutamyl-gamma-aminobutyrate hydrolase PuuD